MAPTFPTGAVSLKDALLSVPTSAAKTSTSSRKDSSSPDNIGSKNHHIVVQHKHYVDHSNDNRADYKEDLPARGGVTVPFPIRLHEMLEAVERDGYSHIISWAPHGRCILIHKPKEFVEILPTYFKLSKLPSFQRQLNLYGFQRLTRGRDRGGYYNELFLRNRVFLAHGIQRQKVKGTGVRARSNPDQEPDFWSMPFVEDSQALPASSSSAPLSTPVPRMPQQQQNQLEGLQNSVSSLFGSMEMPPLYASPPTVVSKSSSNNSLNDDLCIGFGNKQFHYLDPVARPAAAPVTIAPPLSSSSSFDLLPSPPTSWTQSAVDDAVDEILGKDMDEFFNDFDFPEESILEDSNLEDDNVFGELLEQMIA